MGDTDTIAVMEVFVLLVAAASLLALVTRRVTILPYSVALTFLGLAVAALALPVQVTVDPEILLAVLVPGLVFEAAYRIEVADLVPNLAAVGMLATVGVLITAGTVGLILSAVTDLPFSLAFLVGTMLAATDPAAVVAVIGKLRAPRRLTTLIEAESLFNDGTGIVIFVLAIEAFGRDVPPLEMVGGLIATAVISLAIGFAVGFLTSRAVARVDDHLVELTLSFVAAYGSYLLAERMGQSGILATVTCGLVFGSWGRRAASARAEDAIDTVWGFVAFLMTTVVFLLIGLAITIPQLASAALPILAALAGILVSRAIVVYGILGPGSRLAARLGWARALPASWLHLVAWAGLRGAIAVALALSLPADLPQRDLLQGTVFGVVLLTLLIQGTTIEPLASRLGLGRRED